MAELCWLARGCLRKRPTNIEARRAVAAIEQLGRLRHPPVPTPEVLADISKAISEALAEVLSPAERIELAREVMARWEAEAFEVDISEVDRSTVGDLDRFEDLQGWRPLWEVVLPLGHRATSQARFRTPQAEYEAVNAAQAGEESRRSTLVVVTGSGDTSHRVPTAPASPDPAVEAAMEELAAFEEAGPVRERQARLPDRPGRAGDRRGRGVTPAGGRDDAEVAGALLPRGAARGAGRTGPRPALEGLQATRRDDKGGAAEPDQIGPGDRRMNHEDQRPRAGVRSPG